MTHILKDITLPTEKDFSYVRFCDGTAHEPDAHNYPQGTMVTYEEWIADEWCTACLEEANA